MRTLKAMLVCAVLLAGAAPARASADWSWSWADFCSWWGGHSEQYQNDSTPDRAIQDYRNSRGAPEPLTLVAMGLGASAVSLAAWRRRRKQG